MTSMETFMFCTNISMELFGKHFHLKVALDDVYKNRTYLQVVYHAPCTKTGINQEWKGRKWYLSEYMTQDEVVKTAYVAFKMAVEHEVMEGFKFAGTIVFNPHVNYEELINISEKEVTR